MSPAPGSSSLFFAALLLFWLSACPSSSSQPVSNVTVIGSVFCDICSNNSFTKHSYFLQGARVQVQCSFRANATAREEIVITTERMTDRFGIYRVDIPPVDGFECREGHVIDSFCRANLVGSSSPMCNVPGMATSAEHLAIRFSQSNLCIYNLNALNYRPVKKDVALCGQNSMVTAAAAKVKGELMNASLFFWPPYWHDPRWRFPFPFPFTRAPSSFPFPFSSPPSFPLPRWLAPSPPSFPLPRWLAPSPPPAFRFPFPFLSPPPSSSPFQFPPFPFASPPPPAFHFPLPFSSSPPPPPPSFPHIPFLPSPPPPPPPPSLPFTFPPNPFASSPPPPSPPPPSFHFPFPPISNPFTPSPPPPPPPPSPPPPSLPFPFPHFPPFDPTPAPAPPSPPPPQAPPFSWTDPATGFHPPPAPPNPEDNP